MKPQLVLAIDEAKHTEKNGYTNNQSNLTGCACVMSGYSRLATLCMCITVIMLARFSPYQNFQLSCAQCETHTYTTIQGVNGGLGFKMCGCILKAWRSNKVHNQAKLSWTSSENHRDPILTQQYLIKEETESRQSMPQEWKYSPSVLPVSPEIELTAFKKPHPYSATLVAFYLLVVPKKMKLKALLIMSFPVSSYTKERGLGKYIAVYTSNRKGNKSSETISIR